MIKRKRITVALPKVLAMKVRTAVESGAYCSHSEVVMEALVHWHEQCELRKAKLERLRRLPINESTSRALAKE